MRAIVQRVNRAAVEVDGQPISRIDRGLLVFVGVAHGDSACQAKQLAEKIVNLRVFPDESGRFDRSVHDVGGEVLVVSQFTLYADTRKGRRPSFTAAASPSIAEPLVDCFATAVRGAGLRVSQGLFGASMLVTLCNDGPVTLIMEIE